MPINEVPLHTTFTITVFVGRKTYNYKVEKTYETAQIEHFKLYASNKDFVFSSNRPLLRKKGLNHRNYNMQLIEGKCWNVAFLEYVIEQMKAHIKTIEDYQPNWVHPKNEPEPGKDRRY